MEYNAKIIKYANGKAQLRLYGIPVHFDDVISDSIPKINSIIPEESEKAIENENDNNYELDDSQLHSMINSMSRTKQKIYKLCRANIWDYFVTITFHPERTNRQSYDDVLKSATDYLHAIKRKHKDFCYILVPELHEDKVSWHMHGLFKNIPDCYFVDSHKKDKTGNIIYNLRSYKLGFTECTRIKDNDRVTMYMCKYITKTVFEQSKNRKRYLASRNIEIPTEYKFFHNNQKKLVSSLLDNITYSKTIQFNDSNIIYIELENFDDITEKLNRQLGTSDNFHIDVNEGSSIFNND